MIKTLVVSMCFLGGSLSFAADKTTTQKKATYPEMTQEMRSKMADMHQQMATCLKSEKSFEDCRSEMTTSCQEFGHMMPMGQGMMGGRGMGHNNMMGGHRGMMGGYPGMMTGFCGDKWLQEKDTQKTKTKK